jgi:hypothetical protein
MKDVWALTRELIRLKMVKDASNHPSHFAQLSRRAPFDCACGSSEDNLRSDLKVVFHRPISSLIAFVKTVSVSVALFLRAFESPRSTH